MSWIHKINQFKPLPLPFKDPPTIDSRGLLRMDQLMTPETAYRKRKSNPQYLGSGGYGMAYTKEDEPGFVFKLTRDILEVMQARKRINHPIPCVVKIYSVEHYQKNPDPDIWEIKAEHVTPLDNEQSNVVKQCLQDDFKINMRSLSSKGLKTCLDFAKLFKCLNSHGFFIYDLAPRNIGYDDEEEMVLFDLGLSI